MNKIRINVKRVLCLLLVCLLMTAMVPFSVQATEMEEGPQETTRLDVWDGSIATSFSGGIGTAASPYLISTGAEMALLLEKCKQGYLEVRGYYKLTSDLVMNADFEKYKDWGSTPPKNRWNPQGSFGGSFDGDGHTIYGLYSASEENAVGLFSVVQEGSVSNLTISHSYIRGENQVGAVCGQLSWRAAIINCRNYGIVWGSNSVGGIVGESYQGAEDCKYCVNEGEVTGKNGVGGIIGARTYPQTGWRCVSLSYNTGKVTGEESVGGIIGAFGAATGECTIENCFNIGEITGTVNQIGGIAGSVGYRCPIKNCYNAGKISHPVDARYFGGIVGLYTYYSTPSHSYYLDTTCERGASLEVGNPVDSPISSEDMLNEENFRGFDFSNIWYMDTDRPKLILPDTLVYAITRFVDSGTGLTVNDCAVEIDEDSNIWYVEIDDLICFVGTVADFEASAKIKVSVEGYSDYTIQSEELEITYSTVDNFENVIYLTFIMEGDLKNFDATVYRADYLQSDETTPRAIQQSIDETTPSKVFVDALKESGVTNVLDVWKGFDNFSKLLNDITNVADLNAEPKDLYSGVILSALKASCTVDLVPKEYEDALGDCNKFISVIQKAIEAEFHIDVTSENNFKNLTMPQKEKLANLTDAFFKDNYPNLTSIGNVFSKVTKALDVVGSIENYFERIVSCAIVANASESMKTVLRSVYNDSRITGNSALIAALADCVQIMDSSTNEVIDKIILDEFVAVGTDVAQYLIKNLLWEQVTSILYAQHPAIAMFQAAYEAGKLVSNLLFSTDDTYEQYAKMSAIVDVESLVDKTYHNLKESFSNDKNHDSASAYLSALDLVFALRDDDCVRAYGLVNILDNTIVNKVMQLFGQDKNAEVRKYLKSRQSDYAVNYGSALTGWIYELEVDYPDSGLYERYKGLIDKVSNRIVQKEFVAACPVDVRVYDENKTEVASIVNGVVTCEENISAILKGEEKIIRFFDDGDYTIQYVGTDSGEMDLAVNEFDSDGTVSRLTRYDNVELTKERTYNMDVDEGQLKLIDETGSASAPVTPNFDSEKTTDLHKASITGGTITCNNETVITGDVKEGDLLQLNALMPEGSTFVRWETVPSVPDGVLANSTSETATLIMPDSDISIKAVLKKDGSQGEPGDTETQISLNKTWMQLYVGDTEQLLATTEPTGADVTWSSADQKIATVDATGRIKAVGEGVTTITAATSDGQNAICQVSVKEIDHNSPVEPSWPTYKPQIIESENGTVTTSPSQPCQGDKVTIAATPDAGYKVGSVSVTDKNGKAVTVTNASGGKYTFKQPDSNVTIAVDFVWDNPFTDINDTEQWYYDAVEYVEVSGLMDGLPGGLFAPNKELTRAEAVQVLYNLEGQPTVIESTTFPDLTEDWYKPAIAWAESSGVVDGYEDGTFRPDEPVTRQEFAQMLYNYSAYKGYDLTAQGDLTAFPDGNQVQEWAIPAMAWANGNQLINGHDDGTLEPGGTTTRAQAASILMRFDQNVVGN